MLPINLVCFPFAGGNAYSFNSFRTYLDGKVNMITPELPGRGARFHEPLLTDLPAMTADLVQQMSRQLNQPYALYGHSMGGLLAYLFAHAVKQAGIPAPVHFFCSGCRAPSVPRTAKFHNLPHDQFIDKLRELGGSPDEVLANRELMDFYLPIIRADFTAVENFVWPSLPVLSVPMTVMIATGDKVKDADAAAWQKETDQPVSVLHFAGTHFFILQHTYAVCRVIARRLSAVRIL